MRRGPLFALLLSSVTMPQPAWADGEGEAMERAAAAAAEAALSRPQDLPDVAAVYRVTWQPWGGPARLALWRLTRRHDEIGWIKADGLEEIWRRQRDGIAHERVLRAQRHVVAYAPGDLRALGVEPDWDELGTLFARRDLARLAPAATDHHQLVGRLDGERLQLRWDAAAQLPRELLQRGLHGRVRWERLALLRLEPGGRQPDWQPAGAATGGFERLDAAALGDLASDPVARAGHVRDLRWGWRRQGF